MKEIVTLLILIFLAEMNAYGQDPCAKYYGKGYCVDYIKNRAGRRPTGDPARWNGNVQLKDIRPGDAALFTVPSPWGHVAWIERVIYKANTAIPIKIDISEWNYGPKWVDKPCAVTDLFGIVHKRTVDVSSVRAFWRP